MSKEPVKMERDFLKIESLVDRGLTAIAENKKRSKIFRKAAEELSELNTKLLQRMNDREKISDAQIIGEIIDVEFQIVLLKRVFSISEHRTIRDAKMDKFLKSRDYKKYTKNQQSKISFTITPANRPD